MLCYNHKAIEFWPCGQAVKTEPSQGSIPGSIPGRVTKQVKGEPVSIRRRIRLYRMFQNIEKAAGSLRVEPAAFSCRLFIIST